MSITLNLDPEIEKGLRARVQARGISVDDYLREILQKEPRADEPADCETHYQNLSDLLLNSPFAGADLDLSRHRDYPRPTDLE